MGIGPTVRPLPLLFTAQSLMHTSTAPSFSHSRGIASFRLFHFKSAMASPHLPEDLVIDNILSRLPVKSLLRFRSVCKFWCTLLRTEAFIVKHHKYQIANSKGKILVKHGGGEAEECFSVLSSSSRLRDGGGGDDEMVCVVETLSFNGFEGTLKILGPVNGLLCVSDDRWKMIALWNPATREFKTLPFSPTVCGEAEVYGPIGFGFDTKTYDYKIIRFVLHSWSFMLTRAELYSMKNDSWREITLPCVEMHPTPTCFEPYNNGVYYYTYAPSLLFFDFGEEEFRELPIPDLFESMYTKPNCFAIFNKQLSVMVSRQESGTTLIDVWVMTEVGDEEASWKKHVTVGPLNGMMRPLGFWKNSLFLEHGIRASTGELLLYDLNTRQLVNLRLQGNKFCLGITRYVESLVRMNDSRRVESEPFMRESIQN